MSAYLPLAIEHPPGSGTYQDIGPGSGFGGYFLSEHESVLSATPEVEARPNAAGLLRSLSIDGRLVPLFLHHEQAYIDWQAYHKLVSQWFQPGLDRPGNGLTGGRYLKVRWIDEATDLRLLVHVQRRARRANFIDVYDIDLLAVQPTLERLNQQSQVITGSGTITTAGTARAGAILELTGTAAAMARRMRLTDNSGKGVVQYPVIVDSGATQTPSTTVWALVGDVPAPCSVTLNRYYWVLVNVPAGGFTDVYIVNTGVVNPNINTLNNGALDAGMTSSLSVLVWDDYRISSHPSKPGQWKAKVFPQPAGRPEDMGFGITAESLSGVTFTLNTPAVGNPNNANAMLCTLPLPAGLSNALTNLRRITTNHTSGVRSYVRYRTADSEAWVDAWTATTNGNVTTSLDIDNAVEIVVGIEYTGATPTDGAALALSGDFSCALSTPLSGSLGTTAYRTLNGTITNSTTGQVITFTNFAFPGTGLTIDCSAPLGERVKPSAAGPTFGSVAFSDMTGGFELAPGENTIVEAVAGTVTVRWRDTYA